MNSQDNKESYRQWKAAQGIEPYEDVPFTVMGVECVENDLRALAKMLEEKTTIKRLIWGKALSEVKYGFGDASGLVFGATLCKAQKKKKDRRKAGLHNWCLVGTVTGEIFQLS